VSVTPDNIPALLMFVWSTVAAAYVMFEHAQRLEREAKGPGVLQKLVSLLSDYGRDAAV